MVAVITTAVGVVAVPPPLPAAKRMPATTITAITASAIYTVLVSAMAPHRCPYMYRPVYDCSGTPRW